MRGKTENMKLSKYADKDFYRKIMQLALPIIFQNLINTAVNSADVLMLGFVNQTSLSASSLANQISFVLNLFYSGVASGTIMLCAQYWGRQQLRTIEKIMGIAMRLSMSISILFGSRPSDADFYCRPGNDCGGELLSADSRAILFVYGIFSGLSVCDAEY